MLGTTVWHSQRLTPPSAVGQSGCRDKRISFMLLFYICDCIYIFEYVVCASTWQVYNTRACGVYVKLHGATENFSTTSSVDGWSHPAAQKGHAYMSLFSRVLYSCTVMHLVSLVKIRSYLQVTEVVFTVCSTAARTMKYEIVIVCQVCMYYSLIMFLANFN